MIFVTPSVHATIQKRIVRYYKRHICAGIYDGTDFDLARDTSYRVWSFAGLYFLCKWLYLFEQQWRSESRVLQKNQEGNSRFKWRWVSPIDQLVK